MARAAAARLPRRCSILASAPILRNLRWTVTCTCTRIVVETSAYDTNGAPASVRCVTSSSSSPSSWSSSRTDSGRRRHHHHHRHRDEGRESRSARRSVDVGGHHQWHDAHSTLGIQVGSPLDEARRAFVRLALQWHPDKIPSSPALPPPPKDLQPAARHDEFVKVRSAYETIRAEHERRRQGDASSSSSSSSSSESPASFGRDALRSWYFRETGEELSAGFAMEDATRREVAHVHATLAPGGLDRGGMWELARQLAAAENAEQDAVRPLSATYLLSAEPSPSPSPSSTTPANDDAAATSTSSVIRRRKRG
jgi:curved DNA-binding protein CbpA